MTIQRNALCAAGVALMTSALSHAAQMNWTAPASGSFQDPGNWSSGSVPGANDLVVLDLATAGTTISFGGDVETLSFEMWDGTYVLDLNGHTYALTAIAAPFNLLGPGAYDLRIREGTLTAWSAFMTETGDLRIASDGALEIELSLVMGHFGQSAVYVDGGTLSAQSAQIGQGSGSGALTVRSGAVATFDGPVDLASDGFAVSDLVVRGLGTQAEGITDLECTTGRAFVGLDDWATLETGIAWLGFNALTFDVLVEDGAVWTITNELIVNAADVVIGDGGLIDVVGAEGTEMTAGSIDLQGGTLRTTRLERFGGSFLFNGAATLEITSDDLIIGTGGPFGSLTLVTDQEVIAHQDAFVARTGGNTNITLVGGTMTVGDDMHIGNGAGTDGLIQLASSPTEPARLDVADRLVVGFGQGTGALGLYGENDVVEAHRMTVLATGALDQQAGTTIVHDDFIAGGTIDQLGGLLAVGDDPPAEHTSGLVVNSLDPNGAYFHSDGPTTVQGIWLATGVNGSARIKAGGPWICNGPLVAGRADGAISEAIISVFDTFEVEGDMTLHAGTWMRLRDGFLKADQIDNHGRISGWGRIDAPLTNDGVLDPTSIFDAFEGDEMLGLYQLDNAYTQTANGTLDIAIESATEHDRLIIAGPTQLAGTLKVELTDGYEPPLGEPFEIIEVTGGNVITGSFDVEPVGFDVIYLAQSVLVARNDACPADIDDSGVVGFADLLLLVAQWGACPASCPWDLDGSGQVGFSDLQILLQAWGTCGDS